MKIGRKTIITAIVLSLVGLIIAFNLAFYYLHNQSQKMLDDSLGQRLLSIARTVGTEIESDVENDLEYGELSLSTIARLQRYLNAIQEADDLSAIYLLDTSMINILSLDDSLLEVELLSNLHIEEINHCWLGEETISKLYNIDRRYFKAAFYPVGTDSVVAVLVVESSFQLFDQFNSFKDNILLVNILAVILLIIIALIIFLLNRKLIKTEQLLMSQSALSQMGRMTAVIAHEVRNPLAIIRATADRLRKKYMIDNNDQELFNYIPEEVERLNEITSNYLQFASPVRSSEQLQPLGMIVDSVVDGIGKQFSHKDIKFDCNIEDRIKDVELDAISIRQILLNLLLNALDATPKEGKVAINIRSNDKNIHLTISDTGNGLSKAELKQVFDPFYTTKSKGSGLGLYVVKTLVDNLKGKIKIESKPEDGTKFDIHIPITGGK